MGKKNSNGQKIGGQKVGNQRKDIKEQSSGPKLPDLMESEDVELQQNSTMGGIEQSLGQSELTIPSVLTSEQMLSNEEEDLTRTRDMLLMSVSGEGDPHGGLTEMRLQNGANLGAVTESLERVVNDEIPVLVQKKAEECDHCADAQVRLNTACVAAEAQASVLKKYVDQERVLRRLVEEELETKRAMIARLEEQVQELRSHSEPLEVQQLKEKCATLERRLMQKDDEVRRAERKLNDIILPVGPGNNSQTAAGQASRSTNPKTNPRDNTGGSPTASSDEKTSSLLVPLGITMGLSFVAGLLVHSVLRR